MFDPQVPLSLLETQKWLGDIIIHPLQKDNKLAKHLANDAYCYVSPSLTLTPRERVEIYHQQYWWRLLEIMQENYPSVLRLFGYSDFNDKIAIPFLQRYPSCHFSLSRLGDFLPKFIEEYYQENDQKLVLEMAKIDQMVNFSFACGHYPLSNITSEQLLNVSLTLQPHVHLYSAEADFLFFREQFLKNSPEYYSTQPFPELICERKHAIIFRTLNNIVSWKYLSEPAYKILSMIHNGHSIADSCAIMEEEQWPVEDDISLWFYEWTSNQWLTLS